MRIEQLILQSKYRCQRTFYFLFPFYKEPKRNTNAFICREFATKPAISLNDTSTRRATETAPATVPVSMATTFQFLHLVLENVTHQLQIYQLIGWSTAQLKSFSRKVVEVEELQLTMFYGFHITQWRERRPSFC